MFQIAIGLVESPVERELSVVDFFQRSILTFPQGANGDVNPIRVVTASTFLTPAGISLTVDDEFLISDSSGNSVVVLPRTDSGTVPPVRLLAGPETMIDTPIYLVSTRSLFPGNVLQPETVPEPHLGTRMFLLVGLFMAELARRGPHRSPSERSG